MPSTETAFTALRIEGGLLPPEFLARVAALEAGGQTPTDYGVPPGRTLRDEIGRYWSIAEALWKEYREQRQRADVVQVKVGVERWLSRLLREVLGYSDLSQAIERAQVGERDFPISHWAHGGRLPLVLTTFEYDFDRPHRRFGEENRKRSPHAALQEYLNAQQTALWGIGSNGVKVRLLRDNPSLTRPAFLEIDLERIFEEKLYADFAAFWLLTHVSRAVPDTNGVAGHRWEAWRSEGAKVGQRALDNLRAGVTSALRELGSGFVEHSANEALRIALRDGSFTPDGLHQQLLRLVYRLLFLLAAEDRDLLHPDDVQQDVINLYREGYSIARLRERARFKRNYDEHGDLWSGLTVTFLALARGAHPLGLPALGGLFNPEQCLDLDRASITNARLLAAIHALAFFTSEGALQRVNYRDMGAEELGSVYESLLELHPAIHVAARPWTFGFVGDESGIGAKGNERKLSGSYYTPDSLVQELLRSALDPVIERTIRENPQDPRCALLALKIVDPACGSGHFLLGAARHMADALARLETDSDLSDEAIRRHALREVVRRCIYGVDRNPLSVELCKTALWIETIEPGKPLSFLDAHIKCGDSLVGVFDLKVLRNGIPDEAFKELTSDDKGYCRELKKRNKAERESPTLGLLPDVSMPAALSEAIIALTDAPEETLDQVEEKKRSFLALQTCPASFDLKVACDLWCAAYFLPKTERPEYKGRDLVPTTDTIWQFMREPSSVYGPLISIVEKSARRSRFFHWPLEFPDVFASDGFDCILGNPPWERLKLQDVEFFSAKSDKIASAQTASHRKALIKSLSTAKKDSWEGRLYREYIAEKRLAESANDFCRYSDRYTLSAKGDFNTYALFTELALKLSCPTGGFGMVVPSGLATESSTSTLFEHLSSKGLVASFYDFENRAGFFRGLHTKHKFAAVTCLHNRTSAMRLCFFASDMTDLADSRKIIKLETSDIALLNPNTRTLPIIRTNFDYDLLKKLYANGSVLIDRTRGENPWGLSYLTMFHMALDSHLFLHAPNDRCLPLLEAKMFYHHDHRWGGFDDISDNEFEIAKGDPGFEPKPRFWVSAEHVKAKLKERGWHQDWLIAYRNVSDSRNERTFAASILPVCGVGHSASLMIPSKNLDISPLLIANANSIVLDFIARQKIPAMNVSAFMVDQLSFISPGSYSGAAIQFISRRVAELSFTSHSVAGFARSLGWDGPPASWDVDRRAEIKAELDAIYAHLYGLARDELRYILDPSDIHGPSFPSETFRVLKDKEIRQFGEYRTARLTLAAWDRFVADGTFAAVSGTPARAVA